MFLIDSMALASWMSGGGNEVARSKLEIGFGPNGRKGVLRVEYCKVASFSSGFAFETALAKGTINAPRQMNVESFILVELFASAGYLPGD